MKGFLLAILTGIVFFVSACKEDNIETLFPPKPPDPCDSISYKKHIKPIIDVNCGSSAICHGSGSANDFTNYDSTFRHLPNFRNRLFEDKVSPMPPVGQQPLTDEQYREFKCWLDGGYKNN